MQQRMNTGHVQQLLVMKIYFSVHLERVSCRMFGKASSAARRACRCPPCEADSRHCQLSITDILSRYVWSIQHLATCGEISFEANTHVTEQQESKKSLRNGTQPTYKMSDRHTCRVAWERQGQLPKFQSVLLVVKKFLQKASTGRKVSPSNSENLAGLCRSKWYLSAFRSAISLCRQMYCVSKFRIYFSAASEFEVKVLQ